MARSSPLSPPPFPLGEVEACELVKGALLWRIHATANGPIYFGKSSKYRFDDPAGAYGVLYAGTDAHCAFLETHGRVPGPKIILQHKLQLRSISVLRVTSTLRLADLRGHHLSQLRVDSNLFALTDYAATQAWSRAFYEHADRVDGLIFHSRHDPTRHAVALFDRAKGAQRSLFVHRTEPLLGAAFAYELEAILQLYKFAIV